jgi:hypothetical protein
MKVPMALRHSALAARVVWLVLVFSAPAAAQLLNQDHPGEYSREDIAAGNRVYGVQCIQCHGRDGDQISGIDLRRGLVPPVDLNEDLARRSRPRRGVCSVRAAAGG